MAKLARVSSSSHASEVIEFYFTRSSSAVVGVVCPAEIA